MAYYIWYDTTSLILLLYHHNFFYTTYSNWKCLLFIDTFFTNLLTDLAKALLRVMRNWIVVSLMFADHMLSFSSFPDGTYASKYLQYEFHLSAADASAIRGKKKNNAYSYIYDWRHQLRIAFKVWSVLHQIIHTLYEGIWGNVLLCE